MSHPPPKRAVIRAASSSRGRVSKRVRTSGSGCRMPSRPAGAQRRKYAGQLAALTTVESLQQTPVVACGHGELVIGKLEGPVASHNPRREIFVHDDHDGTLSRLREVGIAAAQEGIGGGNGVKAGLEVVNQVSGREPPQELRDRTPTDGDRRPDGVDDVPRAIRHRCSCHHHARDRCRTDGRRGRAWSPAPKQSLHAPIACHW